MSLSRIRENRFRRVSRYLAALLFLCAALRLLTPVAAVVNPIWATAGLSCTPACTVSLDPVRLLDRELRDRARVQPGMEARIAEGLRSGGTRTGIAAARILRSIPEVLFFLACGFAALAFSRTGIRRSTLAWLRTAAWSALAWPFAGIAAHAVNSLATTQMVTGRREVHIGIYGQDLIFGFAVAAALWLIIWALQEALSLRDEVDDFV